MRNLLLSMVFLLLVGTARSQNADSIHTLSEKEISEGRFFTEDDVTEMLKQFEKAEAFDTIFAAKEEEARDLTNVAIRMQHNLDLQNRLNDDFRKQIADKENQNVNCQKEIEILIKSNKRDKFKKGVIAFLVGALVGGFTHALLK